MRVHPWWFRRLTCATSLLLFLVTYASCDDEHPSMPMDNDDSGVFGDASDPGDMGHDRGRGTDAGGEGDATENPCATHSDCPCPDGICISTGECWCPPCETDDDCWDGLSCRSGVCAETPAECIGPPRITPDHGPTTGGTLFYVEGMEFYIGALEWWGQIGDGPGIRPAYGADVGPTNCRMAFVTPTMEAGTYPVSVWYGGYPSYDGDPRGADPAGHFTFEESDDLVGHGFCRSNAQCDTPLEVCELGLGRCVINMCASVFCDDGVCDPVEGCAPETDACEDDSDCKLIFSSCTCDAVGTSDPRDQLDLCHLGGCDVCDHNHCASEFIEAACVRGRCTERRGDPEGQPCRDLAFSEINGTLAPGTWINTLDTADNGDHVAMTWTAPTGEAHFRHGVIGFALLDPSSPGDATPQQIDDPNGKDSHPAVAWNGEHFGLIWLNERRPPTLVFQAVDSSGQLSGSPQAVDERMDISIMPRLFGSDGGFDAFWAQQDWGTDDGFYHAALSSDGSVVGDVDILDWIVPSLESFTVQPYSDHFLVAWPNSLYGREGLFVSHFPLSDSPIQLVTEAGAGVSITTNTDSYTLAWRDNRDTTVGIPLQMRSYDRDDVPLIPAVNVSEYRVNSAAPEVSYLGGMFLVSWFEWNHETDTTRLVFDLVRDDGLDVDDDPPISYDGLERAVQFHQRLDDRILVGWVEPEGAWEAVRFGIWECVR